MPAVRRRRHVLADRRDRPERGRDHRRGSRAKWRSRRSRRSRDGRPATRTTRARSSTGSARPSACRPRSSLGLSCSGGSASCSRRSPAAGRWWRSSTTSTSPRPPSSSCSTTCSTRSTARRSCCWRPPDRSSSRPGRSGPRATRTSPIVLEPLSADESDAIIGELLGGLEASGAATDRRRRRGQPAVRRADHRDAGRDRRDPAGGRGLGRHQRPNEIEIPPTVQALVAARLDALQNEERQVIDPASVIGLGFAVDAARQPRPGGCGAGGAGPPPDPDREAVRPPDVDVRGGLLPLRPLGHQGRGVPKPAQANPRRPPRTVRRLGRAGQPRARPRDRVRGDPRLPPRAGLPLPDGARADRRLAARSDAARPRSSPRPGGGRWGAATSRPPPACSSARLHCCPADDPERWRCCRISRSHGWSSATLAGRGCCAARWLRRHVDDSRPRRSGTHGHLLRRALFAGRPTTGASRRPDRSSVISRSSKVLTRSGKRLPGACGRAGRRSRADGRTWRTPPPRLSSTPVTPATPGPSPEPPCRTRRQASTVRPVLEAIGEGEELLRQSGTDQVAVVLIGVQLAQLYAMRGEFSARESSYQGARASCRTWAPVSQRRARQSVPPGSSPWRATWRRRRPNCDETTTR